MKIKLEEGCYKAPLLKIIYLFPRRSRKTVVPASGEKLWGLRGKTPKKKKPSRSESFSNCNCNRCRLSLQALPTSQR